MVFRMLTAKALATIKPVRDGRTHFLPDVAVGGLGVRYGAKGRPSFTLAYRVAGQQRRVSLGKWWDQEGAPPPGWITLAAARAEAVSIKEAAARGIEAAPPSRAPVASAAAPTVADCIADYARRRLGKLKTGGEVLRVLYKELAGVADQPIDAITRGDIRAVLDALMAGGKPVMANRTRAYLSAFFSDAVERDLIAVSPIEKMRQPAKETSRDRVLADAELARLWQNDLPIPYRAAIRVLMLTGQRRGETVNMEWSELDLAAGEWRIPAAKTKTGRAQHVVHLSRLAVATIEECGRVDGCPYVFTFDGRRPISAKGLTERFPIDDATPHDLRRTFTTGCQKLGVEYDVREICVNHIAGGVAAVYARHDYLAERKAAMLLWGTHVEGLLRGSVA